MEEQLQRDFEYFLPLRWAFYCHLDSHENPWNFEEWREYLLSWEDWSAENEVRAFQTNPRFQSNVLQFLADKVSKGLAGKRFIKGVKKQYILIFLPHLDGA